MDKDCIYLHGKKGRNVKKAVFIVILALLFLSALIHGSQSAQSGIKTRTSSRLELEKEALKEPYTPKKPDLRNEEYLRRFAWCNQDSVYLSVGTSLPKEHVLKLREAILAENGKIVNTFSTGEIVKAVAVSVPLKHAYHFAEKLRTNNLVRYVGASVKIKSDWIPNDPSWSYQWGPQKIQADWAWNITIGSPSVLVAVVDTGIDYNHPELASNYVPLGYDWINNDTDPVDDNGHGTHCAGIIAAELNNNMGIAGLAQVSIMAEKVLNSTGWGWDFTVAQGICHATDMGAKIISMSLGCYEDSPVMYEAVKYAYDHGVLLVAAAGNDHTSSPHYPAAYNEVIAVAATNQNDAPASFSNFGEWIELSAPGVRIYSTYINDSYAFAQGTSMACPHVSGLAALVWSRFPNFTRDELRWHLQRTADKLTLKSFDMYYGYGRVNAKKAVERVPEHDIDLVEWQCPYYIVLGESGIFNATVFGYGKNNETNVSVQFFINGTLVDSVIIEFLEQGSFTTVNFSWVATTLGWYNATCYVEPVAGEEVEENNLASFRMLVRLPVPITLRVPDDYTEIQTAVYAAYYGDTIYVRRGTYHESVIVNKAVSLVGERMEITIVDADFVGFGFKIVHDNVNITGFTIKRAGESVTHAAVYLYSVKYCNIYGNNITETLFTGVNLYSSSNNSVFENIFKANKGLSILCNNARHNSIYKNSFLGNTYCVELLWSHFNEIFGNIFTGNEGCAIELWSSSNNSIFGNTLINNHDGISLVSSLNNYIYHNNFVNNTNQFVVKESSNFWDDGYPSGGNYWSDYTGVDLYSGPYQNITGSDGIGDTPYIIDANNRDLYPLMKPYGVPPSLTYSLTITTTAGGTTNPPPGTYNYTLGSAVQVMAIPSSSCVFDHWELNNVNVGSINPYTVLMDQDHTLKAVFSIQPLSVSITPSTAEIKVGESITFTATVSGGLPPYSYQWYVNGSAVEGATSQLWMFTPTTPGTYIIHLNVADSTSQTARSNTATVTVAPPLVVSISLTSASILVGQSITFTSTVSGGYPPYTYQWYLNGNPVSGATSATLTFTSTTAGIYYVRLEVTDGKDNTAQSNTARITVATVSVGGYSISIQTPPTTKHLTPYLILTAILTITYTTIKHKTNKKNKEYSISHC